LSGQQLRVSQQTGATLANEIGTDCAAGRGETSVQNHEADVTRVRAAILDYLEHHGNAADTREGITDWWLPVEQRAVDRAVVERALETLVADGLLDVARLVDGTVLYRRASAP
jgi:Fe2+ or Zn2+ uptake regulation protein